MWDTLIKAAAVWFLFFTWPISPSVLNKMQVWLDPTAGARWLEKRPHQDRRQELAEPPPEKRARALLRGLLPNIPISLMHFVFLKKSLFCFGLVFFARGWESGEMLTAGVVCPTTAAPVPGTARARVAPGVFPRLMANPDQDLNYSDLWFSTQGILGQGQRGSANHAAASAAALEALSKQPVVCAVPVRRFGNQHPRNWLGTAISRQIWQFSPRKHKRFLPTGMHPTPMKEITALPAVLEEGLRFSPSAPVCCLARYLQLKSFCFKLLCLAVEGGTGGDSRRDKLPHLQQLLRGGGRRLPPAPAQTGRAHLEAPFISYILSHSSKNPFNHFFF